MTSGFSIREATTDDHACIMASWLNTMRQTDTFRQLSNTVYFKHQKDLIIKLLTKYGALIVCVESQPDEIAGWFCGYRDKHTKKLIVHFIYVKSLYHKLGLAKALLHSTGHTKGQELIATAIVEPYNRLVLRGHNVTNNPFLAWEHI